MVTRSNRLFACLVCIAVLVGLLGPAECARGGWLCTLLRICGSRGVDGDGWPRTMVAMLPPPGGWTTVPGLSIADLARLRASAAELAVVCGPMVSVTPEDYETEGMALTAADFACIEALADEGRYEEAACEAERRSDDPVAAMVAARLRLLKRGISADETNRQVYRLTDMARRLRNHNVAASAALTAAFEAERVANSQAAAAALELAMQRLTMVDPSAMSASECTTAGALFTEIMGGWVRLGPNSLEHPCEAWQRAMEARDRAMDSLARVTCPTSDSGLCSCARECRRSLLQAELTAARGDHGWLASPKRAAEVEAALSELAAE